MKDIISILFNLFIIGVVSLWVSNAFKNNKSKKYKALTILLLAGCIDSFFSVHFEMVYNYISYLCGPIEVISLCVIILSLGKEVISSIKGYKRKVKSLNFEYNQKSSIW